MLNFLFGEDLRLDDREITRLNPRLYDVEVVAGVAGRMEEEYNRRVQDFEDRRPDYQIDLESWKSENAITITVQAPRVRPGVTPASGQIVPARELDGLSAPQRNRLTVQGVGSFVSFGPGEPWFRASDPALQRDLAAFLTSEGRRRLPVRRWMSVLPILGALILVLAWFAQTSSEKMPAALLLFGWLLCGAVLIGAIALTRWLANQVSQRPLGHAVRNVGRAEYRQRLANITVNIWITVFGTVLGVILTVVFYKLTGVTPV